MVEKSGEVVCPFYRSDDGSKRILCEGFVDNSYLVQQYTYKEDFRKQKRIFCSEHCSCCEVYRMLTEAKYSDV